MYQHETQWRKKRVMKVCWMNMAKFT